ncbi:MAG: MBL fold metallo-hydrolase [Chitinophagales bacterium]
MLPDNLPFKIHVIHGYICNLYLLEYDQGLVLFDTGAANDVKRLERYMANHLQRSPDNIKLAVVSHAHPDHCGGAVLLRKKYNIPLAAHRNIDRWYAGPGGTLQHKLDIYMMLLVARSNKRHLERVLFDRQVKPDYPLDDLDCLPMFPDWQVFTTPGHTIHDIVLFNKDAGLLYASDLVLQINDKYLPPLVVPFPDMMKQSLDRVSSLNPGTIMFAHGDIMDVNDPEAFFSSVKQALDLPMGMKKRVKKLSSFSPEIKNPGGRP